VTPYYADDLVTLHLGDCLDVLAGLADCSVDAVVTDPPYGLEFMGKDWDGADGFRRSLNPADADRDSVFGRASRTGPEYRTSKARIRTRTDGRTNPREGKSVTVTPEAYVAGNLYQRWCEAWAAECLRVLKPGGHMLAFGGTRTYHRLVCAVEDAGFEIRDSIQWIYGSGFPKSLDVGKAIDKAAGAQREVTGPNRWAGRNPVADHARQGLTFADDSYVRSIDPPLTAPATDDAARWDGWGTALKPSHEPIVVARKPLAGTIAANVLEHGSGALNIDGCRVDTTDDLNGGAYTDGRTGRAMAPGGAARNVADLGDFQPAAGRWPPNVLLSPDAAAELDRQSGVLTSGRLEPHHDAKPTGNGSMNGGNYAGRIHGSFGGDTGGASRFFPVFRYQAKAPAAERHHDHDGAGHPTVKPLALIAWLVRLVTPPGGLVLDPFAGSGTTGEACIIEGFRCILIEKNPAYAQRIRARLNRPIQPAMVMPHG